LKDRIEHYKLYPRPIATSCVHHDNRVAHAPALPIGPPATLPLLRRGGPGGGL